MKLMSKNKIHSGIGLIVLAYIAFISLGLPDGLLGVAWPSIRISFSRSLDSLGLLLFATMAGYLTSSFYSGRMIAHIEIGWLLAASCAATGLGLIGYTLVPAWWMMIALGVIAGLGAGAIDAGINTYAASNFDKSVMQWLHASYGIGVTLGPIIMTTGISIFNSWRLGYILVGAAQLALAICFAATASMWQRSKDHNRSEAEQLLTDYKTPIFETLHQFNVWLSILLFFLYAGVEATLGSWAYTLLTESRGISSKAAGLWVGSYWATFTIGRIFAGMYTRYISVHSLMRISLLAAFTGSIMLLWNPTGVISLLGVAVTGFAIAPVFPGMVSGTSRRVSQRYAANTIGMQISAAGFGVAVIPGLAGVLAQRTSLEVIPAFLTVLIILLYVFYSLSIQREFRN